MLSTSFAFNRNVNQVSTSELSYRVSEPVIFELIQSFSVLAGAKVLTN